MLVRFRVTVTIRMRAGVKLEFGLSFEPWSAGSVSQLDGDGDGDGVAGSVSQLEHSPQC